MFASAINTQMDTVQASGVVSSLVITAATAGAGFSASDLNFNNTVIGYATLMENAGEGYTISTYAGAQATLEKLDAEMLFINGERAKIGSVVNRLEYAIDNLRNVSMNTKASRSQILDADYAEQSTELARTQIIQQAATSVLAQANSTQESVLKLLQ
jgi:flagellin